MADIPESTKMLPCPNPWCENIRGVEAARHITTAKWHICCGDCLIDGPWTDTCDLAIAAWNTRAAPPAMDREAVEKVREAAYRQALEDVCNPLGYLQRMADAEGAKLSGTAYAIASNIATVQRIAKDALSTLSADAVRQGEGVAQFGAVVFQQVWDSFIDGGWDIEVNDLITKDALKAGLVSVEPFDPKGHVDPSGAAQPGDDFYQLTDAGREAFATPASHASDGGKAA